MGLNGKNTQVLETTTGTVVKEWNFANPEDIGTRGWGGYLVLTSTVPSPSPEAVQAPTLNTVLASPNLVTNQKIPLIFQLVDGWARVWADQGLPNKSVTLVNTSPGINLSAIKTDVVVEVVMRADYKRLVNGQFIGGVTANKARVTMFLGGSDQLARDSRMELDEQGLATYRFVFERAKISQARKKVIALSINPTILDNNYLFGLMIDRITVSAK